MRMKLPKTISPCPIKEAVAEVRFESNVPPDAVFGITYQALKKNFTKVQHLPIVALPPNVRNASKDLAFQPHYRLLSENLVVLVGPKVISVGMRGEYPGWSVLSPRIKETFLQLHQTGIVARTVRLGLRYINFFTFDIYPNLLLKITVNDSSLGGEGTFFKTVLTGGSCKSILNIGKGVALVNKPGQTGSIIDIDSYTTDASGDFVSTLERFLEDAHQTEKELFFKLLKPEFLNTLKPVYENEG
jgi:uncharacterized protein (TIGR04255 family)